jgi:HD-like signal output (HDOD) protein
MFKKVDHEAEEVSKKVQLNPTLAGKILQTASS